nr:MULTISPECIES: response regulator transcription factor [unclassified Streptomyces]
MSLRLPADPTPWPPEVATTVHRIVQEALTNIARHAAHARSADVEITHGPDTLTDGAEAAELARRLRPDVCLVDIRIPRLDGIDVTRALAGPGLADPLRVVIVTTFDLDEYVHGALRAGAVGFVLKGAAPALLIEAVRAAHAGDALISPSITLRLLRDLTRPVRHPSPAPRNRSRPGRRR